MDEWGPANVPMLYDHDGTRLRECHSPTPVPPPLLFFSPITQTEGSEDQLLQKHEEEACPLMSGVVILGKRK